MKASELRAMDMGGLHTELENLLRAHFALRMQVSTQQSNKTADLGKIRRDIARVKTVLREKVQA